MSTVRSVCLSALLIATSAVSVGAQTPAPDPNAPPAILTIFRESIKIGKNAAHEVNEQAWAGVLAKAKWETGWLGTTALTGPNEAWYFTGYPSWEAFEKDTTAKEAAESLAATRPLAALDGDFVGNTSQIAVSAGHELPGHRPAGYDAVLHDQLRASQARLRGRVRRTLARDRRGPQGSEAGRALGGVSVSAGAPQGTFLFIYARKSLSELDAAGGLHTSDAYRNATGEDGRAKNLDMTREAVEVDTTNHFAFSPKMSYVPKAWVDADPTFWTPPAPAPVVKKPGDKK